MVLDFDPRHGSDHSLVQLEADHGPLGDTRSTKTGGDGNHRIYDYPTGLLLTNKVPSVLAVYEGIDVRGQGGYIAAPPSRHISGGTYEWVTDPEAERAQLPDWIIQDLEPELPAGPIDNNVEAWTRAALTGECKKVAGAPYGKRNDILWVASLKLGGVVAGGSLDQHQAYDSLLYAARKCGLSESEAVDVITRGLEAGRDNPRGPGRAITSREEALVYLDAVSELFARMPRKGYQGIRMRVCMEAMIDIARMKGGPGNVLTTIKEISIFAGTGRGCIQKALGELRQEGWLHLSRQGYQGVPSRWEVRVPAQYQAELDQLLEDREPEDVSISETQFIHELRHAKSPTNTHPRIPVGHDVFLSPDTFMTDTGLLSKSRGLGKSSWIIWRYLESPRIWRRQSDIVRATERCRSTVHNVVKALHAYEMVEQGPEGVRALEVSDEHLDLVARALKTDGHHKERLKLYRALKPGMGTHAT